MVTPLPTVAGQPSIGRITQKLGVLSGPGAGVVNHPAQAPAGSAARPAWPSAPITAS